jgi:hypothetical protein
MNRRRFLGYSALGGATRPSPISGQWTTPSITEAYLARIDCNRSDRR